MTNDRSKPSARLRPAAIPILVIDDDPDLRRMLERVLGREGFLVEFHVTAAGAMREERALHRFPLIILDNLLLPDDILTDGSGITLCRMLRGEQFRYAGKIIFLSALDDGEIKAFALRAGADDYVAKPFNQAELIARIKTLCSGSPTFPRRKLTNLPPNARSKLDFVPLSTNASHAIAHRMDLAITRVEFARKPELAQAARLSSMIGRCLRPSR